MCRSSFFFKAIKDKNKKNEEDWKISEENENEMKFIMNKIENKQTINDNNNNKSELLSFRADNSGLNINNNNNSDILLLDLLMQD